MKTTTTFVVALTVFSTNFLGSTASPTPSLLGGIFKTVDKVVESAVDLLIGQSADAKANCPIDDQTRAMIYERIAISDARLTEVTDASKVSWANAGDEYKEGLTEVNFILDYLNTRVPVIHNDLKALVNCDSAVDCKEVIAAMNAVIVKIKSFQASLKPIPADLKAVMDNGFGTIMKNAGDASKVIPCKADAETNCAINDQNCKMILERIEISNKCLNKINDATTDALAKASPELKELLTEGVAVWLMDFNVIVPEIHEQLKKTCNGGSEADREEVIARMKKAVTDTKSFLANLTTETPMDLKAVLDECLGTITNNAIDVTKVFECKENVVGDDLKQEIDNRIQANTDALGEAKKCLAEATGDEKDRLIPAQDFLNSLGETFSGLVSKIKKFVNATSLDGRDELVNEMHTASKETKATLDSLEGIPEVKNCLDTKIWLMIANCDYVAEKLSEL